MSPHSARIAVLPREVASQVVARAVAWSAWAIGVVILALTIPVVIDVMVRSNSADGLAVPLLAIAGMFGLFAFMAWRPSLLSRLTFLGVGGVLAAVYATNLLLADPTLNDAGVYVINRPAVVLVLVAPGILRPMVGIAWAALGFLVGSSALIISQLIVGVTLFPGWGSTISLGIFVSAYLLVGLTKVSRAAQLPDLRRLEAETTRQALENQYEQRAAAVIHDSVLSDLSVVMNSAGALDERTRERFRADVTMLSDGAWLRESRDTFEPDSADATLRNGTVALVSEMQWRGLTVDITGNPETEIVRLSSERITALHGAVRASLENVLQHAKVTSAELAIGVGADSVTIMVIDQGVGFNLEDVASDRLGLRESIAARVERYGGTVKLWSTPGRGTSVMITMPAEVIP